MHNYKIFLTQEAILDIVQIADYIEASFTKERADRFQKEIQMEMEKLSYMGGIFPKTKILYRGYVIHKKNFPPSVIFYILSPNTNELHILRVLREEQNWMKILRNTHLTYPN